MSDAILTIWGYVDAKQRGCHRKFTSRSSDRYMTIWGFIPKLSNHQLPNRRSEVTELRQQGLSCGEIADVFGISRERVCQLLRRNNMASKAFRNDIINRATAEISANATSIMEVADGLGIKYQSAYKRLKRLGKDGVSSLISRRRSTDDAKYIGKPFGRLIVTGIERTRRNTGRCNKLAICECSCGNKNVKVELNNLISGRSKSCGCLLMEYWEHMHHHGGRGW